MILLIKHLLDSIKFRANKDIRETLLKNSDFNKNRWTTLERSITWGAKNTFKATLSIVTFFIILAIVTAENHDLIKSRLPHPINNLVTVSEIQSTLLGTQATLIGLIFPLVIAFIGILLQGKSSNKAMWAIYKDCSGFMLVGFSSLALIISITLTHSISPWLETPYIAAFSYVLTTWFLLNITLSGWFLWITIKFLQNEERMLMVLKYSINEVLKEDIRERLERHHSKVALQKELCEKTSNKNLKIKPYTLEELPKKIAKRTHDRKIHDIFLRPLNIGISLIDFKIDYFSIKKNNEQGVLCFSVQVNEKGSQNNQVAETDLKRTNLIAKTIIRLSIQTSPIKPRNTLTVAEIVAALFGQLEDSLKENNSKQFQQSENELINFQKQIEKSCQFINYEGKPDNWLLLTEAKIFGRDFISTFMWEGTKISSLVTNRIQQDSSYYEYWCYFYLGLFALENPNRPTKIGQEYINGHYLIWKELMEWLAGTEKGISLKNKNEDRAVKCFVGSWESWSHRIGKDEAKAKENEYWYKINHLEKTSAMAIQATKHNNEEATKWAIDVLINWEDKFIKDYDLVNYYIWHSSIITPDLIKQPTNEMIYKVSGDNEFNETEAAAISLTNYWLDVRCLTAAYLISSGFLNDASSVSILNALTRSERLKPTGEIGFTEHTISNIQDLLSIFLRQNGSWDTQSEYKSRLEKHIENLASIQEPAWVSGRIYSWNGNTYNEHLSSFFFIYGVGLSQREFKISNDWNNFLRDCTFIVKKNLISSLEDLIKSETEKDIKTLTIFDIDKEELAKRKENFIKSIERIISELKGFINSEIVNSEKDPKILEKFSTYASGENFSKLKGPIPLRFFKTVKYRPSSQVPIKTIEIKNFDKADIGKDIEKYRVINEEEWLGNVMKQRIQIELLQQIIKNTNWVANEKESVIKVIETAVKDGKLIIKKNQSPILFVGSWEVFKKIDESKWQYAPTEEILPYTIRVESGMPDDYVCHLENIEVYRLPFSKSVECFLIPKENMETVEIAEFSNKLYVEVDFEESHNLAATGSLLLKYGIESHITTEKGYRYIYKSEQD